MRPRISLNLTIKEIEQAFSPEWAERFPPILSVAQAADLAQMPKGTIYSWSSQGMLDSCAARAGRHLRIARNRFVQAIFNERLCGS